MQFEAYKQGCLKTHYKVAKVVDGDGFIAYNIFDKKEIEIRLLGIDAPEIKRCKKLLQDEREVHVPGQLLMELGKRSFKFLSDLLNKDSSISFYTETKNEIDPYGRLLAYVFLPDGSCINEILLKEGFVKTYNKSYCSRLAEYQSLNMSAKAEKKGLYEVVNTF